MKRRRRKGRVSLCTWTREPIGGRRCEVGGVCTCAGCLLNSSGIYPSVGRTLQSGNPGLFAGKSTPCSVGVELFKQPHLWWMRKLFNLSLFCLLTSVRQPENVCPGLFLCKEISFKVLLLKSDGVMMQTVFLSLERLKLHSSLIYCCVDWQSFKRCNISWVLKSDAGAATQEVLASDTSSWLPGEKAAFLNSFTSASWNFSPRLLFSICQTRSIFL